MTRTRVDAGTEMGGVIQRTEPAPPDAVPADATRRTAAIIPAFNEQSTIGTIILVAKKHVDQVVVVDDGSADDTADVARLAGALVLRHARNAGKGRALHTGLEWARDEGVDAVVLLDADGQHDPEEIPKLLEPIRVGDASLTLGIRYGANTEMPSWRRAGKRALDYSTAAASGSRVTDSQTGFRALDKEAIHALRVTEAGFAAESEMLVLAKKQGIRVAEVPVTCAYDDLDTSTHGPMRHAVGVLVGLLRVVGEQRPLLLLGGPATLMMIAGILLAAHVANTLRQTGEVALGTAVFASLLVLASLTMGLAAVILHVLPGAIAKQVRQQVATYPPVERHE